MRMVIGVILLLQCACLAFGVHLLFNGNPNDTGVAVFNICVNIIFGALNIKTLFSS